MTRPNAYRLPNGVLYEVDAEQGHVQTIFGDGSCVTGVAQYGDEDESRARSLGYHGEAEDVCWALHRDHDLIHTIVSQAEGWPWSQTLWLLAHGFDTPPGLAMREERLVFLLTRTLNLGGQLPEALLAA